MFYRGRYKFPGLYYPLRMPQGLVAVRGWEWWGSSGSVKARTGSQEKDIWGTQQQSQPQALTGHLPGDETALRAGALPTLSEDFADFVLWLQSIYELCSKLGSPRFPRMSLVGTFILSKQKTTSKVIYSDDKSDYHIL